MLSNYLKQELLKQREACLFIKSIFKPESEYGNDCPIFVFNLGNCAVAAPQG